MTAYVTLLRAVNVGGRNRLPMAELRATLSARGFDGVTTVLQSGNVLLESADPEQVVAATVAETIEASFGLRIGVVVRTAAELTAIAGRNPFLASDEERDPATLHVAFLSKRPSAASVATLDPDRSPPDSFMLEGRELYLSYPNGSGRSKLTLDYLERCLGVQATARNWRTVQRLAA
jgi:uncharacterized protein (DUF1697 family)